MLQFQIGYKWFQAAMLHYIIGHEFLYVLCRYTTMLFYKVVEIIYKHFGA